MKKCLYMKYLKERQRLDTKGLFPLLKATCKNKTTLLIIYTKLESALTLYYPEPKVKSKQVLSTFVTLY